MGQDFGSFMDNFKNLRKIKRKLKRKFSLEKCAQIILYI